MPGHIFALISQRHTPPFRQEAPCVSPASRDPHDFQSLMLYLGRSGSSHPFSIHYPPGTGYEQFEVPVSLDFVGFYVSL